MKLNAVGVTTTNMAKTVEFYSILGFKFPEFKKDEVHLEAITEQDSARLMIDSKKIVQTGFKVVKEPWDAFWAQRYCIVEDPDGYKIDLYAKL